MKKERYEQLRTFLHRLDHISENERRALRDSGRSCIPFNASVRQEAINAFIRYCPEDLLPYEMPIWYFAACLHCMSDTDAKRMPFEKRIRQYMQAGGSESYLNRINIIVNTKWDSKDWYLAKNITSIIKCVSRKVGDVDVAKLIYDIDSLRFDTTAPGVRCRWAKEIYRT